MLQSIIDVLSKIEAGESFNVRLRFVDTKEYLFPVDRDYTEDVRRRRVLTFPLDAELENNDAADWLLEPIRQESQDPVIRLSSVRYRGEYLLAGTDDLTLDLDRRKVYTWKETGTDFSGWGGPDEWILVHRQNPDDDRAAFEHFTLRNRKFDEDLYASSDRFELDNKYGTVYTWRQDTEIKDPASQAGAPNNVWEVIIRQKQ